MCAHPLQKIWCKLPCRAGRMLFSRIHALSIKRMRNPRCDFVQELSPRSLCRTAHSFFRFHHRFTAVSRVFPPMRSFFRRKSMVARLLKTRSARCASLISPCTGWQHAFKSRMRAFYPAVKPEDSSLLCMLAIRLGTRFTPMRSACNQRKRRLIASFYFSSKQRGKLMLQHAYATTIFTMFFTAITLRTVLPSIQGCTSGAANTRASVSSLERPAGTVTRARTFPFTCTPSSIVEATSAASSHFGQAEA